MKRRIFKIAIPALACAMVFTGGFSAYADNIMEQTSVVADLTSAKLNFTEYSGKVTAVKVSEENENLGSITLSDDTGEILVLNMVKGCPVFDAANKDYINLADIKEGDNITIILGGDIPMTASLPPIVNQASMIVKTDDLMSVKIDAFDEEFLSSDKQLKINLGDESYIRDVNGSRKIFTPEDIIGKQCAVIYSFTTRSLPPQTSPDAIIILGDEETDTEETVAESTLVPLRETFEKLGYKVEWTSNNLPIKLVKDGITVEITIGSKEFKINGEKYIADKAAVLTDSVTFIDSSIAEKAK